MKNKLFINLFVGFVKLTGYIPAILLFKPRIYTAGKSGKRLPKGCILVSNHKSLLDFALYLVIFPFRTIRFLMAEVLYSKGKLFSFFLNSVGGIKVERNDLDFSFASEAIQILDEGGTVGIFPEARLPVNGKPFPFTTSTAFIALHSGAPVVPVYTDGNYGISKRTNVSVGEPIYLSDFCVDGLSDDEQIKHLTDILEKKVYELADSIPTK